MRPLGGIGAAVLVVVILWTAPAAHALEGVYTYPQIEPRISLTQGLRVVGTSGSNVRAGEYENLRDDVVLGGEFKAFPFPQRFRLELDVANSKDFYTDFNYAYRDVVLSRWIGRSVFHNLENFELVDLPAPPPPPPPPPVPVHTVERRDAGEVYGTTTTINDLFLRFKTPTFPFHVYASAHLVDREGSVQQRFLGGSGGIDEQERISEKRDVDWHTRDVTFGTNSHLGPVEVDLSHTEKRFEVDSDSVRDHSYGQAEFPLGTTVRAAGIYPHSAVPDLEGSTTTLKLHTSYTGRLVAALTLSTADRENELSGAGAEYLSGAGDLIWSPRESLVLAFKYRYRDMEAETPDSLPAGYLGFSSYASSLAVEPAVSSRTSTYSTDARVRVTRWLNLNAGFAYRETDREDTGGDVLLPEETTESTLSLSARVRLPKRLKVRAGLEHTETDNPAYNTEPENADSARVSASWTPLRWLQTFASYRVAIEERDKTSFESGDAGDREALRHKGSVRLTFLPATTVSVTTSVTYLRNTVEQDIVYDATSLSSVPRDDNVKYGDRATNYLAAVTARPVEQVRLQASVSHTRTEGEFAPDPLEVASLSELRTRETTYEAGGEFDVMKNLALGLIYEYTDFENLHEEPDNPVLKDGTVQIVTITASVRW